MAVQAAFAAASIGFKIFGASKRRKAAKYQRAANRLRNGVVTRRNAASRRELVRQARIARGQAKAAQVRSGASGSVAGGLGSIDSQLKFGLQFADSQQALSDQAFRFEQRAGSAASRAATFDALGDLSGSLAGPDGFTDLGRKVKGLFT